MNWHSILVSCVVTAAVCPLGFVRAAVASLNGPPDLASEVREVFAAKCAGCHGAGLAKPKGRFGYVLDLARVAANRELVVPSSPDESELWDLVMRGEMPPADAPNGALSARQKEVIRTWIAAGAPAGPTSPAEDLPLVDSSWGTGAETRPAAPTGKQFLPWVGKFHLLFLHFPIALLTAAAAAEAWSIVLRSRTPSQVVRFCVLLGATSAITTAALGWLHALGGNGAGMPLLLNVHRWLGTAAGTWAVATAVFSERDARRGVRVWQTRGLLFVGAFLIGLNAHFGAILVHGEDFFDWR
jgi:mono/diheme cytochrome c family protein